MERTLEEWETARQSADKSSILSVTDALGMSLTKSGRIYTWADHDSLVISPHRNSYYWNSRGKGGGPIQLVQAVKECSLKEAIHFIEDGTLSEFKETDFPKKADFRYFVNEQTDMSDTYNYLTQKRQLSKETVDFFIEKNMLTQATYRKKELEHEETVIVFKHVDRHHKIKGMAYQGIEAYPEVHGIDRPVLKRTLGNGFYGLAVPIGTIPEGNSITEDTPLKLVVFEAPIDLMSYYELNKESLKDTVLLSMNGLRKGTVSTFIANSLNPGMDENQKQEFLDNMQRRSTGKTTAIDVTLAVDNDKAGRQFVDDFGIDFINVQTELPPLAPNERKSDWNDVLKEQKETMDMTKQPTHYFEIEFNESEPDKGVPNLKGTKITPESYQLLRDLDTTVAHQNLEKFEGYYKVYLDEIKDGQQVNTIRLDIGSGVNSNFAIYKALEEHILLPEKQVEDPLVKPVKEGQQGFTANYTVSFDNALKEELETMPITGEPTEHYLTEKEVKDLLANHLTQIEQLVASYQQSADWIETPTPDKGESLKKGLFETIKEGALDYKKGLSQLIQTKKAKTVVLTKNSIQSLKVGVSNAFNTRVLQINQSIFEFVVQVDRKFSKETNAVMSEGKQEEPLIEDVSLTRGDQVEEQKVPKVPNINLIELGREFSLLTEEVNGLTSDIAKIIADNPLSDVRLLQNQIMEKKDRLNTIGDQIETDRATFNPDVVVESKMDTATKLALLVNQKDALTIERDQWVNHPEFLYSKVDSTELDSPLARFNQSDEKINAINQLIKDLEQGIDINESHIVAATQGTKEIVQTKQTELVTQHNVDRTEKKLTSEEVAALSSAIQLQKKELLEPQSFKQYLDATTQFHSYSAKNVQMIREQAPDATQVASEAKWKQLGYELKENAQPVHVYAPSKEGSSVNGKVDFYLKPVYDVSQTTAEKPLPPITLDKENVEQFADVITGLTATLPNQRLGTDTSLQTINQSFSETIKSYVDLAVSQTLKTNSTGSLKEFELNSVSYIVANHLGLDEKNGYSLDGISLFNDSPESMKQLDSSLKTITKTSNKLVESINKSVQEKIKPLSKFEQRVVEGNAKNKQVMEQAPQKNQEQLVARSR